MPEGNGSEKFDFLSGDLPREKAKELLEKNEQWPTCPSCGSVCDNTSRFCGNCGAENARFSTEEFHKQFGTTLEATQKQQGCHTGHIEAATDKDRISKYCIYCGRRY